MLPFKVEAETVTWSPAEIAPPFPVVAVLPVRVDSETETVPSAEIAPPLPPAVFPISCEFDES